MAESERVRNKMRKGQTDRDREKHLEKIQTDKNR